VEASRAADALAKASAALVGETDIAGSLATLLSSSTDVLRADASGILVQDDDHLDLLAASSHSAVELELHQAQLDEGPCVEAHRSGQAVNAHGPDLVARWPKFGQTMLDSGFSSVHASPLRWHGLALGAMGVFRRADTLLTPQEETVAQAFADLTTLLIVHTGKVDLGAVRRCVHDVLTARIVIEQAKGVLAWNHGLDMADAYQMLLRRAAQDGGNLTTAAQTVVDEARHGPTT
jgi:transcriptional regulator with GAF, ATPase, and Fis domain